MSFDYFYGQQSDLFTFYRVPKVLFTNERFWNISADAKMLYGILLDRMSLSAKNGWIDKNGRVYIIFTIDEAKMALNCAEQKAIKLLSELEKKAGLIERKRQGLGKPNLIYVKNFISAVDILNVKLRNKGLNSVISNSGLSEDDMERYRILLQTRGNRPDIFGNDIYATPGGEYTDYDIPGEALTDTRFANMIREAEKYLGYPYVWGGSSPSTSFDCSGFVSYVINHCGNGWSVGRLTANGLMGVCDIIPKSSAKPGDLIFFQGTYDTSGASHVGIYVGNGMMIHCGNPISYASIESNYWQQHFYCFGRIRN